MKNQQKFTEQQIIESKQEFIGTVIVTLFLIITTVILMVTTN
jgi:hypothetical protein